MSAITKPRQQWIAMLAKLVAPIEPIAAAKALSEMMPMLADIPDGAFSLASLDYVARQCKRTPTYGELRASVSAWWLDNRPKQALLENPLNEVWSAKVARERAEAIADWSNPDKVRASVQLLDGHPMAEFLGGMLGGLVKRHAPQNLVVLPPRWQDPPTTEGGRK